MSAIGSDDLRWLDAAVRFASPFSGTTGENPAVAALVVDAERNRLLARAVTARRGRPHAVAQVLENAGFEAAGRTLFATLEPCSHWGRSPPCTEAIIRSGVMRVVIGALDADPRTAGLGVARLESAGIEVAVAEHVPSRAHHAGHILRHTAGRPFLTVLVGAFGEDRSAALRDTLRARADAILIDAGSARNGLDPVIHTSGLASRTPMRIVLSGVTGADRSLGLVSRFSGYRTAVIAETHAPVTVPASVDVIRVAGEHGRPDLAAALAELARRGVQQVVVEAGPRLVDQLLELGVVDRIVIADGKAPIMQAGAGLVEVEASGSLRVFERPA